MWKENDKKPIGEFLFWTFFICWGTIGIIVAIERINLFPGTIEKALVMTLIGLGSGLSPAYAVLIIMKKYKNIKFKQFVKRVFECDNFKISFLTLLAIMLFELIKCAVTESYTGYPIYFFLLMIPLMIFGGGLEEIGWRGFLQPALEEKMNFLAATLVQGTIWSIWHIPLWFVLNANQRNFSFVSFFIYCVSFSFSLALLYRAGKCVFTVIILHAWGNVVLGGMFSFNALTTFPKTETLIFYIFEIGISLLIVRMMQRKRDGGHKILIVNTSSGQKDNISELYEMGETIHTAELNIHNCIGCNSCWIKTPGRCPLRDDFEMLFKKILGSDIVVFVADEKMGMVAYQMKNIIDRMIALDLPYTCIKNGQARHAARYNKNWKFMLVLPETENMSYINKWFHRVAINFHSTSLGTYSINNTEEIKNVLYNY